MNQKCKLAMEKDQSKITFLENNTSYEIDFYSIKEETDFFVGKENTEIYEAFKDFVLELNKGELNTLGEERKDLVIESESDMLGSGYMGINIESDGLHFGFSSIFHTSIFFLKSNNSKKLEEVKKLFERLRSIDCRYYQTYISDFFPEEREFQLLLK